LIAFNRIGRRDFIANLQQQQQQQWVRAPYYLYTRVCVHATVVVVAVHTAVEVPSRGIYLDI